ncbi:MAG: DUF1570 domain-containing protein [Planctomycetota bacterium]|nr:DUF1570 domain-containing protein [Planctomycetota bacterium]
MSSYHEPVQVPTSNLLSGLLLPTFVVLGATIGCQKDEFLKRTSGTDPLTREASPVSSAGAVSGNPLFVVSSEPWIPSVGGGPAGSLITTPHYQLHTTLEDGWLSEKMPAYLESALEHYRTAIIELPLPDQLMDTYILGERAQWQAFTRKLLPGEAGLYLSLGKGGFTTRGRAVLYDIGRWDTLCITAHEGWHQYCQNTFQEGLPAWLDEGIATYMEGCRFERSYDIPRFLPWRNFERFYELRTCARRDSFIPLYEILTSSPEAFLREGRNELLAYYAQVWALTHFLMEGEGGRYRPMLEAVLRDAHNGELGRTLLESPRLGSITQRRRAAKGARGLAVALVYFNPDIVELQAQFDAFIEQIVARGSGNDIARGRSPLREAE